MSNAEFPVRCKVCFREVDKFTQQINFILISDQSVQERETIELSCGCIIDFPEWRIDPEEGICRIYDYADTLYLEFYDKEVQYLEDDE